MKLFYIETYLNNGKFYVIANSFDEAEKLVLKEIKKKGYNYERQVAEIKIIADTEPEWSSVRGCVPTKLLMEDEEFEIPDNLKPETEVFMDGEKMRDNEIIEKDC